MSNKRGLIKFFCYNHIMEYYAAISIILQKNIYNKEIYSWQVVQKIDMLKEHVNKLWHVSKLPKMTALASEGLY